MAIDAQTIQLFINHHREIIHQYGYLAVFGLIFLEDFGVPSPGELTLIGTSVIAAEKGLNISFVLILAWLGAVAGDNIGFMIGHFGGIRLLEKYGRFVGLSREKLIYTRDFFNRWGGSVVIFARFVEILRQLNGIIAGSLGMSWKHFFVFNAVGASLWVAFWGLGTYFLGQVFFLYLPMIIKGSYALGALTIVGLIVIGGVWWVRKRKKFDH